MKKLFTLFFAATFIVCLPYTAFCGVKAKKITINTENFASIFADNKLVGTTTATIKIPAYGTVNIRVEKPGYITRERNYVNDGNHEIPFKDYIQLEKDDALENSVITDIANRDIDIRAGKPEDESWKLVNRITTGYFDVIAITDKATGYLCTAWVVKQFKSATVRTRLIIKTGNSDPLTYKAKIISEIAKPGTSGSADESFRAWDRLLRSFENTIPELQSRLPK